MPARDLGLLAVTSALMASAFLFVRLAAPAFGAYPLAALRVAGATALLAAIALVRGRRMRFVRGPGPYLALGALSVAIPFTLVAWAGARLPASLMAVLAATLPSFTAVTEAAWRRRRPHGRQIAGLALGLAGVAQLSGFATSLPSVEEATAVAAPLLASVSYALGTLYAKTRFIGVAAAPLTLGSLAGAAALLAPVALAVGRVRPPSASALGALLGLVAIATVAASLLYYRLLGRQGPTAANCMAYLVPLFGAAYGSLLLGERLEPPMALGGAVVLLSVALVTGGRDAGSAGGADRASLDARSRRSRLEGASRCRATPAGRWTTPPARPVGAWPRSRRSPPRRSRRRCPE